MRYLLFEKSAIEYIIGCTEFQSVEFAIGKAFIDYMRGGITSFAVDELFVKKKKRIPRSIKRAMSS